ncbi:hypothetical protein BOSE62_71344 [Bosea sp. 62]|nr:hypothetical protein BOSE21B_90283 [Bosea sp. 21B]CAD5295346.1 hypothetical protein BOSE46_80379 [Bosea sp. 46]CAD5298463.1 hypothetical protein BOSE7B_60382 [Bosea sp. 7B]VVT60929.1 hypothetical protein BOS5A_230206 [Bosea sp. EC-HK365B]VXB36166.1 hypothetical protein BOSE127_110381 [Bosea sp. 127]VXB57769.1 hypothetical protein BOSE125_131126 [Bosea sp. 125]VXC76316.1 hypothetical protein BOSE29B_80269 [Bosea sp. 29B]VXC90328.1 hypothetical protein BOSE62_71344 [Bosea sp. 62]
MFGMPPLHPGVLQGRNCVKELIWLLPSILASMTSKWVNEHFKRAGRWVLFYNGEVLFDLVFGNIFPGTSALRISDRPLSGCEPCDSVYLSSMRHAASFARADFNMTKMFEPKSTSRSRRRRG